MKKANGFKEMVKALELARTVAVPVRGAGCISKTVQPV